MAKENSFDIVSKTDYAEVTNAINQTRKEISQRFDFKGSKALVDLFANDLILSAEDETKLRNMNDILAVETRQTRDFAQGSRLSKGRTVGRRHRSPTRKNPTGNSD